MTLHLKNRHLIAMILVFTTLSAWVLADAGSGLSANGYSSVLPANSIVPLDPFRLVDTRPGNEAFRPQESRVYDIRGYRIPSDATGVMLNITVPNPSAQSFITVWPSGTARPTVSTLNPTPGLILSNAATVRLGSSGGFSVYNHAGTAHVIVDVVGYVSSGGGGGTSPARKQTIEWYSPNDSFASCGGFRSDTVLSDAFLSNSLFSGTTLNKTYTRLKRCSIDVLVP
jgi:hypothetical protein